MPYTKGFKKLLGSLSDSYEGEKVPKEYQKSYGKRYDKKEIKSIAYAIAKSKGINYWIR